MKFHFYIIFRCKADCKTAVFWPFVLCFRVMFVRSLRRQIFAFKKCQSRNYSAPLSLLTEEEQAVKDQGKLSKAVLQ